MRKDIIVKVQTPLGERHIVYCPITIESEDEIVCDTKCPYGKMHLCDKLRDPRDPEKAEYCFMNFCQEIDPQKDVTTPDKDVVMNGYVPAENTIETNLADIIDINKDLLKTDPHIKISKVVDTICPDWCPDYTPDHAKCSSKNISCIIKGLFKEVENEINTSSKQETKNDVLGENKQNESGGTC